MKNTLMSMALGNVLLYGRFSKDDNGQEPSTLMNLNGMLYAGVQHKF